MGRSRNAAGLVVLVLALGACGGNAPEAAGVETDRVEIGDIFFKPPDIVVKAGTEVTWTNVGNLPHSVTAADRMLFDSHPGCPGGACLSKGDIFRHTFTEPGTFGYYCRVHRAAHYGTVRVVT